MNDPNITLKLGLQGHRGARGLFPENTMAGFKAAIALGVDAIELDVGLTSDGVAVVSHDLTLNPDIARNGNGAWLAARGGAVRDHTWASLQAYDVGRLRPGSAYAAQFPDQRPSDGARIPTLREALGVGPDVRFTIELKTDPRYPALSPDPRDVAEAVLAVIDTAGVAARICVESFDWRGLRHIRSVRPDIPLSWLTRAETEDAAALWWDGPTPGDFGGSVPRAVAAEGGPIWAPDYTDLTQDKLDEAHALGLMVLTWTVNDAPAMRRLADWGVDGLITDRPDIWHALMPAGNSR